MVELDELDDMPIVGAEAREAEPPAEPDVDYGVSSELLATATAKSSALDAYLNILTSGYKFDEFARQLLLAIMRVVSCEAGSILEVDRANESIFFRAVAGSASAPVANFVIPMGTGIVGHVIESRQPMVVENVPENAMHLKAIQKAVGFETLNLVAFPLLIRGEVFGVLELLNRTGQPNFTRSDIELLTYLCQMAAKAIEIRLMIAWANQARKNSAEGGL